MFTYSFDVASICIYILIWIYYIRNNHVKNVQHRCFGILLLATTCISVFDILGALTIDYRMAAPVTYITNMCYYLAESITSWMFVLYVKVQLEFLRYRSKLSMFILHIPIAMMAIFTLTTPITGLVFSFSDAQGWQYGPFRILVYVVYSLYFIWAALYTIVRHKEFSREFRIQIIFTFIINLSSMLIQYFMPELLLKGFAASLSMTILWFGRVSKESLIDKTTGLARRTELSALLHKMMLNKIPFSLVMTRIADYDLLVSSYGISTANKYIKSYSQRIAEKVPHGFAFNISADTNGFIVLQDTLDTAGGIKLYEQKLLEELSQPVVIKEAEITSSLYVTAVTYPGKAATVEDFIAYTNYFQNMRRAKYGIVPEEEMLIRDNVRRKKVLTAIKNGLETDAIQAYYQPICTTKDQRFITSEALARLIDPELGFIPPDEFIILAEENGLIIPLGYKIIDSVCSFLEKNDLASLGVEYIELNLSVVQCLQSDFIDDLIEILSRHKIKTSQICLEITETASNSAPQILVDNLRQLKELGFKLALDDFGNGYASLERLVQNNFDVIKFDKNMLQHTFAEERLRQMFVKMINLFHSLDQKVVAEGVETADHYNFLKENDCDFIQGYYFSKPLPGKDYIEFLKNHQ